MTNPTITQWLRATEVLLAHLFVRAPPHVAKRISRGSIRLITCGRSCPQRLGMVATAAFARQCNATHTLSRFCAALPLGVSHDGYRRSFVISDRCGGSGFGSSL